MLGTRLVIVGFLILLYSAKAAGQAPRSGYSPAVRARIQEVERDLHDGKARTPAHPRQTIHQRMAHHGVNALTLAVIKDYQIEWASAYGWADRKERRKATAETLFQPGSISKTVNAVGILRLVDEGTLDLSQDINEYLRSWRFPYDSIAAGQPINLRLLLSHTAGLTVHGFRGYSPGDPLPTVAQILDGTPPANSEPVRSRLPPGLRYEYSGGGVMVAQQVLMDVTGQRYDEYFRERVFTPLGMGSTTFTQPPPAAFAARLATGYPSPEYPVNGKYPVLAEQAAGGLWTTPTDLAKLIIDLQRALEGRPGTLLTRATVRTMMTPVLEGAPGLGVFIDEIRGAKYFQHAAGNAGFSGMYFGSMEGGDGVVVFINSDAGFDLVREVITTVATVYRWAGFSAPEAAR